MRLSDEIRCRQFVTCDVGKRVPDISATSGYMEATVWPQDIMEAPVGFHNLRGEPVPAVDSFSLWIWKVYLNMGQGRSGSGHKTWRVCHGHSKNLYHAWITVAQIEVNEAQQWDRYCDRMESWPIL
jgi:hypothetical protein